MNSWIKSMYLTILDKLPRGTKYPKVVYIMSFGANDGHLIRLLARHYQNQFVVFYTKNAYEYAKILERQGVVIFPYASVYLLFYNQISIVKQAEVLIVDNYYPELSLLPNNQIIILIWHAMGAIKKFGWEDFANRLRTKNDQRRFQKVYDCFSDIVVASPQMAEIFQCSYRCSPEVFRYFGMPKADYLLEKSVEQVKDNCADSTYILYMPTYRTSQKQFLKILKQALNVFKKFPDRKFLIKLHPTIGKILLPLPKNVSITNQSIEHLFSVSHLFITDYSASIFEFLLYKPEANVVFFMPDKAEYESQPGIQASFLQNAPGPIVVTEVELEEQLKKTSSIDNTHRYELFRSYWHTYNDGHSIDRLFQFISEKLGE